MTDRIKGLIDLSIHDYKPLSASKITTFIDEAAHEDKVFMYSNVYMHVAKNPLTDEEDIYNLTWWCTDEQGEGVTGPYSYSNTLDSMKLFIKGMKDCLADLLYGWESINEEETE